MNIVFFAGYSPSPYNGSNYIDFSGNRGSEYCLVKLAEEFAKKHNVTVSYSPIKEACYKGVNYINVDKLQKYLDSNRIDVLIVSRYIHFFLDFNNTAEKTYIWLHDSTLQPYYKGVRLKNSGKHLLNNILDKIDGLITLSEWHQSFVSDYYNTDKVVKIPNGINTHLFNKNKNKKIKNRFIFNSANGGLNRAIDFFKKYKEHNNDSELHVFSSKYISNHDGIIKRDYIPNHKMIQELESSEYWIYPAQVNETFCLSLYEAIAADCSVIANRRGGLADLLLEGFYYDIDLYNDEYNITRMNYENKIIKKSQQKIRDYIFNKLNWSYIVDNHWYPLIEN